MKLITRWMGVLGAVALLLAVGCSSKRKTDTKPFQSLATKAATETAQLLEKQGHVLVICEQAESPQAMQAEHVAAVVKASAAQAEAFKSALAQQGKFTFTPEFHLARGVMTMDPAWPANALGKIIQDLPEGAAVVSFASLPPLGDSDQAALRSKKIRLVVVGQAPSDLRELLDSKSLSLAVVYRRPIPSAPEGKTESPEEWVARVAEVLPAAKPATP